MCDVVDLLEDHLNDLFLMAVFKAHLDTEDNTMSVVYDECYGCLWHLRCSSLSGPEVVNLPVKRAVAWTHGRQVVHPLSFFSGGLFFFFWCVICQGVIRLVG